ncbi:MAG: NB-ARC domain-containing protein [Rivularia sp. (in: cyanobacteria)]
MDSTLNESQLPDIFIEKVATQQGVTKAELIALQLALQGFSGADIAKKLEITPAAVRKRLGESYKKFKIEGSSNKKIYDLKQSLSQKYQEGEAKKPKIIEDWGEAVDVEGFRGREEEISELTRWIVEQRCRLVAVLGLGGIGKTILAARIVKEVRSRDRFKFIIWRSLRNSPQLNDILTEILQFLPNENRIDLDWEDDNLNKKILYLIDVLRKHRCLIILDNVESLFSSSKGKDRELVGKYQDGYENYGDLFERVAETSHQSCLLLTSREKPLQVAMQEGKNLPVKVLQLTGLNLEDANAILKDKGFTDSICSKEQLSELVKLYSGNPLALKMVATTLYDLFNNDVAEFLNQIDKETAVFGDIRTLLEEQFNRLSELEKQLMYCFAINRDIVSLAQIKKVLIVPDNIKILEAVESLLRRSLIEKVPGVGAGRFSLQSVVTQYITEQLIAQAAEEIIYGKDFKIINQYPLIKARSLDYFRESQERSILEPLKKQLVAVFGNEKELESRLKNILQQLQQQPLPRKGYAAGNIINLLRHIQINKSQINLSGLDFSNLIIRQAYFKDVRLQNTQFTNSDLTDSVFSDTMSSLLSVSFSHDGRYFATGVINGEVRLWQTDDIKLLRILKGHTASVKTFAFNPSNTTLASGSDDYKIQLWNIDSGECIRTLNEHTNKVYSVAFNADGKLLASASEDQSVKIWDVDTGNCEKSLTGHTGSVWSVSFHPHNTDIIATGSADGNIKLWNIDTFVCSQTFSGHDGDVYAIDFHPNGELLVSCGIDKTIKLWDLATGTCKNTLFGHERKVYKVRFSADGKTIASSSEDRTIKLWDTSSGQLKRTLSGHTSQVWDIAFHPSGRALISSSDDQTARIWDLEKGICWNILKGYTRDVYSLAFSPDSKVLASGRDDWTIRLWELQNFKCYQLRSHQGRIRSVAYSRDGRTLASGSADRQIKLWDIQDISDVKEIRTLKGHDNWVWSVVFSPDGKTLASSSEDRTIRLWNIETGDCIRIFIGHSDWVCPIAFSPDGKTIVSGSDECKVKLWDVDTGECIQTLHDRKNLVLSVAFSPNGQIATGNQDKTIKLWNMTNGKCLHTLDKHTQQVYSVAFSADGKMLASGSGECTVKLWQVETGRLLHTFEGGHTKPVRSVAFSPDGKLLASGGEDENIQLWDLKTRKQREKLNPDRFYEGMEITNVTGLTYPEKASLRALGAVETIR